MAFLVFHRHDQPLEALKSGTSRWVARSRAFSSNNGPVMGMLRALASLNHAARASSMSEAFPDWCRLHSGLLLDSYYALISSFFTDILENCDWEHPSFLAMSAWEVHHFSSLTTSYLSERERSFLFRFLDVCVAIVEVRVWIKNLESWGLFMLKISSVYRSTFVNTT